MKKSHRVALVFAFTVCATWPCGAAAALPVIDSVEWQPLGAQVRRLNEALEYQGAPISKGDQQNLQKLLSSADHDSAEKVQAILDPYCLLFVNISPESRVKVAQGEARPMLVEQGWKTFLVKVQNESGVTAELRAVSPHAQSLFSGGWFSNPSDKQFKNQELSNQDRWMDLQMFNSQPLRKDLSGLPLEYRMVQIYSRDAGKREAKIMFNVGQGSQDIGFRNEADILFDSQPAHEITLRVKDENGEPTTAGFLIKDAQGHIFPAPAKRLAPDFGFHPQIYRGDGEKLKLPAGRYNIEFNRGPESLTEIREANVTSETRELSFQVKRWIDPSTRGWWSGDHHIHAAGCAHYTKPSEGVHAPDMMRHCLGEDVKVGANLTWGPCFDYQKQFFTGSIDKVSQYPYLLRYDVEVSGFGSHQSGHLCLLRLREQMYPGGDSMDHWPTLCLNTLRWAGKQGAIVGPAHSGWGLEVSSTELPNYTVPPFKGIGANEYIVDVTHEVPGPDGKNVRAVDFISTVDTPYPWELNIWYHTLNVGFRTRISGETDFPCIYGERVGLGRSYVKLDGKLNYDDWCEGIRQGKNYVSDGKSHIFDFAVNDILMGEHGSELKIPGARQVHISAQVAARLNEKPNAEIQNRRFDEKPYWDVERARVGTTRTVPVELIVNGYPVEKKVIEADGQLRKIEFDTPIEKSSWVALRILPSSHTNPIFVLVEGKPIRTSRRSAEWCAKGVDQCW
ncbi:MAG TPA: CehA/McbA family metallohydrolase, partial [Verrucomicrobiae bacterium]|nr:CehA/McbA family metallohydrolase [Verrucomicrobiae bacterium]